jgi:hypothetical protein
MFCESLHSTNVKLNYFLSNKQMFRINMLGSRRASSVQRERNSCKIITKYLQRLHNGIHNNQFWDKISQPHSLTWSLMTSYILCLHSWGSCKRLFNTFHKNSSSCHHKSISRSRSPIIIKALSEYQTASKISDRRYVSIKSLISALQVSLYFLWICPVT